VTDLLTLPQVAERLGVSPNRVRQLLRDGVLLALPTQAGPMIPADFLLGGSVLKGLQGTITLLRDAGYSDEEAGRWLLTADDSLPGSPVAALRENRGVEVKRRAQALGF